MRGQRAVAKDVLQPAREIVTAQVRGGRGRPDRYLAATVTEVVMSDAPGYTPGRNSRTGIDSVVFAGVGSWDGVAGYRFEIAASDRGEPGRGEDRRFHDRSNPGSANR